MAEPISLAERRWNNGDSRPGSYSVRECLEVVIAKLDSGEIQADHVIVAYGKATDGIADDGFYQAGSLDPFAQIGLIERVKHVMMGSGE